MRRVHSPAFKSKVAIEIIKGEQTISQICSQYSIHSTQAGKWKQQALRILENGFSGNSIDDQIREKDKLLDELYKQIGQLKVELDWLKKKMGYTNS